MFETALQRLTAISTLFVYNIGRIPDFDGLFSYLRSNDTIDKIAMRISSSAECQKINAVVDRMRIKLEPYKSKRKILLFGAFGNGNLGDREMAQTVANRLERQDDIVCFAYSVLSFADYPFSPERKLNHEDLPFNILVMSLFDVFIIGGGGLLYYSHEPIWDPFFAVQVPIPIAILGCGVVSPLDERLYKLVDRAIVVSSRDSLGQAELRKRNSTALLCDDPILAFHQLVQAKAKNSDTGICRRLFVLRCPIHSWHLHVKQILREHDAIAIFEPHMDFPLIYEFENAISITSAKQFTLLAQDFDIIITERYHGAILALLARCPVVGIFRNPHAQKFQELFHCLNIEQHLYSITDAPDDLLPYDVTRTVEILQSVRESAEKNYNMFINKIFTLTDKRLQLNCDGSEKAFSSLPTTGNRLNVELHVSDIDFKCNEVLAKEIKDISSFIHKAEVSLAEIPALIDALLIFFKQKYPNINSGTSISKEVQEKSEKHTWLFSKLKSKGKEQEHLNANNQSIFAARKEIIDHARINLKKQKQAIADVMQMFCTVKQLFIEFESQVITHSSDFAILHSNMIMLRNSLEEKQIMSGEQEHELQEIIRFAANLEQTLNDYKDVIVARDQSAAESQVILETQAQSLSEAQVRVEDLEKLLGEARDDIAARDQSAAESQVILETQAQSLSEAQVRVEDLEKLLGEARAAIRHNEFQSQKLYQSLTKERMRNILLRDVIARCGDLESQNLNSLLVKKGISGNYFLDCGQEAIDNAGSNDKDNNKNAPEST